MSPTDEVMTIFRWNRSNPGNTTLGRMPVSMIPVDTWFRVRESGVIPDTAGDGLPTVSVEPIWSFHDVESDNPGGQVMYIDDVSFKVDVPLPTPEPDLEVTNVEYDEDDDMVRITFRSVVGGDLCPRPAIDPQSRRGLGRAGGRARRGRADLYLRGRGRPFLRRAAPVLPDPVDLVA